MGGDHAPSSIIDGALAAARHLDLGLILAGPADVIRGELARHPDAEQLSIRVLDAPDVVAMDESPTAALRRKSRASIRVAADSVASGDAAALVSAGHTGATVMAAHAAFGMLPGVDRPALAATIPRRAWLGEAPQGAKAAPAVLLDVGASVECRPQHLLQSAPLSFIGNIEARDVYSGQADVIVCDGFTGNVALKISEGLVDVIEGLLGEELSSTITVRVGSMLTRRALRRFRRRVDYSEYGGAPLLGVAGVAIVGHGRSSAKAVRNAVAMAYRFASQRFIQRVQDEIAAAAAIAHP